MKRLILVAFFAFSLGGSAVSQDLLELASKVHDATDELGDGLEHLNTVRSALSDITAGKTPIFGDERWQELAKDYKLAAKEISEAALPTDFKKDKYAVSLTDLQNCNLKDTNLKKINDYLQELKEAQQRGRESIIQMDSAAKKIKTSQQVLAYCMVVHEKLGSLPVIGEKFLWDWVELNTDVSAALGTLETAVNTQKRKIASEKLKVDLYVSNLENNLGLMQNYLEKNCGLKLPPEQANNKAGAAPSNSEVKNGFYIFLTADLIINDKRTTVISAPFLRTGSLTDPMTDAKEKFIKQIDLQLQSKSEDFKQTLTANNYQAITLHYAKPYSLVLLKSEKAGYDAIEAFQAFIRESVKGLAYANTIEFYQLNP